MFTKINPPSQTNHDASEKLIAFNYSLCVILDYEAEAILKILWTLRLWYEYN